MTLSALFGRSKHHGLKWWRHALDHFWPHERNNHHPHLLKHRAPFGYSVFLILLKVLVIIAPIALPSSSLFSSAITLDNIINLTNQTRINLDLPELKTSDLLNLAAKEKALDMATNNYFAHTSPTGVTPWDWFKKAGYEYQYAGENLAVNFVTAEGVSDGWMASPSHRANIVNANYTEIGVGVSSGEFQGVGTSFVVQMFGTPRQNQVVTAVMSEPKQTEATIAIALTPPVVTQPESEPVIPEPVIVEDPVDDIIIFPEPVIQEAPIDVPALPVTEIEIQSEPIKDVFDSSVVINSSGFMAVRHNQVYNVSIPVTGAKAVTIHLADESVNLEPGLDNNWSGAIGFDVNTYSKSGEVLTVLAVGQDGTLATKNLAWLAPDAPTQQVYNFNVAPDKYAKFFGLFTVHNLDDSVSRFYLYFMIALGAALLINIFVKIRVQHLSVITHAAAVIALAFVLWVV